MLTDQIDKKALKLLKSYSGVSQLYARSKNPLRPYQQRWIDEFGITSDEEFAYLKEHGLAFDLVDMKHDEAVQKCFEYVKQCKKSQITDLFLSSFATERPDLRSDFAAYAIMQTMPEHRFANSNVPNFCHICSGSDVCIDMDMTDWNAERFKYGSIGPLKVPFIIQFHLAQHLRCAHQTPTSEDFRIFNAILDVLRSAEATAKPKDLHKDLKKISGFKATNDQWKRLLEALGVAGILETEQHKGYLTHYTNPGLAPSKTSSSNWAYPVDFWTGADGVNRKALEFWFGAYPEVLLE
ncbi:hypothetical protein [Massilia pseudoviolaceinigra]|uniref:hypothetical protein n=1 Tax=Massilia pseudoviolaceinigra TaxID=3057165 RepID=UPI002796AB13|nr:hypothetical protein [Massilia sp. CCM 9206]MDQ1920886.1 hypothetical protein [Massilia sp. CCM 9206]